MCRAELRRTDYDGKTGSAVQTVGSRYTEKATNVLSIGSLLGGFPSESLANGSMQRIGARRSLLAETLSCFPFRNRFGIFHVRFSR